MRKVVEVLMLIGIIAFIVFTVIQGGEWIVGTAVGVIILLDFVPRVIADFRGKPPTPVTTEADDDARMRDLEEFADARNLGCASGTTFGCALESSTDD